MASLWHFLSEWCVANFEHVTVTSVSLPLGDWVDEENCRQILGCHVRGSIALCWVKFASVARLLDYATLLVYFTWSIIFFFFLGGIYVLKCLHLDNSSVGYKHSMQISGTT